MSFGAKLGRYEVTSRSISKDDLGLTRRDFDAEEWWYLWVVHEGIQVLRLEEIVASGPSFGFVEFSGPTSIEFVPEEN